MQSFNMPSFVVQNTLPICLWFGSFFLLWIGMRRLSPILKMTLESWGHRKSVAQLKEVNEVLTHLEEWIASGLVPEPGDWNRLEQLPAPWNQVIAKCVRDLREQGAPVLPTLRRLKSTVQHQIEVMQSAQTQSAQAWSQALLGIIVVPIFAYVLSLIMPGLSQQKSSFLAATLLASGMSWVGVIWMIFQIDSASSGQVVRHQRSWFGHSLVAIESLTAKITTGMPPDLAWGSSMGELNDVCEGLSLKWGASVWAEQFLADAAAVAAPITERNDLVRLTLNLGLDIRRAIQVSLVEGRGCLDRISAIQMSFITEYRLKLQRELNLLPSRCLKPLFLGLFPAIFILLGSALFLSVGNAGL